MIRTELENLVKPSEDKHNSHRKTYPSSVPWYLKCQVTEDFWLEYRQVRKINQQSWPTLHTPMGLANLYRMDE